MLGRNPFNLTFSAFFIFLVFNAQSQVVNIESKRLSKDSTGIFGDIELLYSVTKNTQLIIQTDNENQLLWKAKQFQLLLLTNLSIVRANGENLLNGGFSHVRFNKAVLTAKRISWEAYLQSQYNRVQRINYRQLMGLGFRFDVVERDSIETHFGSSVMYEYEEISEDEAFSNVARWSNYLHIQWQVGKSLQLRSTWYVQPRFDWFYDCRISNHTRLGIRFTDNWIWNIKYNIIHDNLPPTGVPKTIYTLENGVEFNF